MTHVYDNTITIFETYNPKLSNLSKHILINIYCKLIYVYRNHSTSHSEINILLIWWRHHSCHIIAFVLRLWVFCYCVTSAVSRVRGHFCRFQPNNHQYCFVYFGCLGFFVPLQRIFHSCGDVTITGEGCKLWPILDTHDHGAVRVL